MDGESEKLCSRPRASWGSRVLVLTQKHLGDCHPLPGQPGVFSSCGSVHFPTEEVRCSSFISVAMTNTQTTGSSGEAGFISVSGIQSMLRRKSSQRVISHPQSRVEGADVCLLAPSQPAVSFLLLLGDGLGNGVA